MGGLEQASPAKAIFLSIVEAKACHKAILPIFLSIVEAKACHKAIIPAT
jgi:hypothetical protein